MRHIEKERLISMSMNEINRALGEASGDGILIVVILNDFDRLITTNQRKLGPVLRGHGVAGPHVVGIGNAKVFIETMVHRQELLVMSKMPFSKHACGVST